MIPPVGRCLHHNKTIYKVDWTGKLEQPTLPTISKDDDKDRDNG